MARPNPFTPGFGSTPPVLAGRDDLIEFFAEGLDAGPGYPSRKTVYVGGRGVGKTVMLNAVEDLARRRGWLVVSESATPGFLGRIVAEHLPAALADTDPQAVRSRLSGVTLPVVGGATWSTTDLHVPVAGFRTQLAAITDILAGNGTGILFTLDELHRQQFDEILEFCTSLQHAVREERPVAFAAAALPSSIEELLVDTRITFLQRAERPELGVISAKDVARALLEPMEAGGRSIPGDALRQAVQATGGYPFMVQLVGFHVWRQHPDEDEISPEDVATGIVDARRRVGSLVYEPTLLPHAGVPRTFLLAMAKDDGPSRVSDIAERLNAGRNYVNQYRARLITAGVIRAVGHGLVDFEMPDMRSYLRDRPASPGLDIEAWDPDGQFDVVDPVVDPVLDVGIAGVLPAARTQWVTSTRGRVSHILSGSGRGTFDTRCGERFLFERAIPSEAPIKRTCISCAPSR